MLSRSRVALSAVSCQNFHPRSSWPSKYRLKKHRVSKLKNALNLPKWNCLSSASTMHTRQSIAHYGHVDGSKIQVLCLYADHNERLVWKCHARTQSSIHDITSEPKSILRFSDIWQKMIGHVELSANICPLRGYQSVFYCKHDCTQCYGVAESLDACSSSIYCQQKNIEDKVLFWVIFNIRKIPSWKIRGTHIQMQSV